MKRFISLLICGLMLASCTPSVSEKSTSSADSISEYTDFLAERIDTMPDELIIATAETSVEYGVDMSDFADDGYLIRADGGKVLILGKTEKALDRAVREYAKNGNDQDFHKVYNEGYRVKKLTIAGNDISEYAILRDDTADECHVYASSELVTYVEKTCGAVLPEYTVSEYAAATDKPARTVLLTVDYPTLGDENFRIEIGDDGNVTISGGRYRGCMYGVYGLLYNIGWRFPGCSTYSSFFTDITETGEYLYEAAHIDLTSEINRTESGAIPDRITRTQEIRNFDNSATNNNYSLGGYGILDGMAHGMQAYHNDIFSGEYEGLYYGLEASGWKQPCYSSEEIYEAVEAWAFRRMEYLLQTYTIEECPAIDVSQWDAFSESFCTCADCIKVVSEEGTIGGPVLRFANRLADSLNETYPGAKVHFLAYAGLEKLPMKTKPSEHIVVSYCFYVGTCQNHCLSGVDCEWNAGFAKDFEDWTEVVAPGQMIVWYYPFTAYANSFHSPFYTIIRDDMKYLSEQGIELLYSCANFSNSGVTNDQLASYLVAKFSWNYDYTDEEMYAIIEEWINIVYGDAGPYIYEYIMLCEKAADMTGCWRSFQSCSTEKVDGNFMVTNFDTMYSLFEVAEAAADTKAVEELVRRFKAGMLYMCVGLSYEDQYTNGTAEQRALIADRYTEMYSIFKEYSIPVYYSLTTYAYVPDELDLETNPMVHWRHLENKW